MAEAAIQEYSATGRRKNAVVRVRLRPGTGKWLVNDREPEAYFFSVAIKSYVEQPMQLTGMMSRFDVVAKAAGGGIAGQAGAMRHALARALSSADQSLREVLKNSGCLTRDPRMKERKKPGQPGARKRFQFSKR